MGTSKDTKCPDVMVVLVNYGKPLPYYRIDIKFGGVVDQPLSLNSLPTAFRYQFSNKVEKLQAEKAANDYLKVVQEYIDGFRGSLLDV